MNKYVKLGLAAAAFVIFFVVIYVLYDNLSARYEPRQNLVVEDTVEEENVEESVPDATEEAKQEPIPAIDFVMENEAGEEIALFDFVGKPIVLNFWASWCGPCKAEIPDFQTIYEECGTEVEFLMVNVTDGMQETKESAMEFIAEQGYTLPFYFDTQMQGSYAYSVYSLPTTFFINTKGEIEAYAQGMIDAETLKYGISMIQEPDTVD